MISIENVVSIIRKHTMDWMIAPFKIHNVIMALENGPLQEIQSWERSPL
jgi:hypothetical protein